MSVQIQVTRCDIFLGYYDAPDDTRAGRVQGAHAAEELWLHRGHRQGLRVGSIFGHRLVRCEGSRRVHRETQVYMEDFLDN